MQQSPVTFEEVAIYFSPEEWVELAAWQRELYQEVMMDNYDLVASLDPESNLIHKLEPEEESCRMGPDGEGDGDTSSTSAWDAHEELSEDNNRQHLVTSPARTAKESGYPTLLSICHDAELEPWDGDVPQELPEWERGERALEEPPVEDEELFICSTCGQSFEDEAGLSAHLCEHLRPAPSHQCGACGKAFRHRRNLLTHKKHRGRFRHSCTECGKAFCVKGDLLRHRASHGGEGGHTCPLCGDVFRHRDDLEAHSKEHTGSGRLRCPECEKCFEDEGSLRRHRAAHREERPFVCGRCDRSFSWKESLVIHQRSHAQERCHRCPDCGRGFSHSGNLAAHQRVHTGERPFACSQCDRSFCNKANLITHKKLHRRCKSFACSLCQLGFSSKSKLLLHQQEHGEGCGETLGAGHNPEGCQQ